MRVKSDNKIYDVEPLEVVSKDQIDNNKLGSISHKKCKIEPVLIIIIL